MTSSQASSIELQKRVTGQAVILLRGSSLPSWSFAKSQFVHGNRRISVRPLTSWSQFTSRCPIRWAWVTWNRRVTCLDVALADLRQTWRRSQNEKCSRIATPPEEDRTTAADNMHNNLAKFGSVVPDTSRHADRHVDRNILRCSTEDGWTVRSMQANNCTIFFYSCTNFKTA